MYLQSEVNRPSIEQINTAALGLHATGGGVVVATKDSPIHMRYLHVLKVALQIKRVSSQQLNNSNQTIERLIASLMQSQTTQTLLRLLCLS